MLGDGVVDENHEAPGFSLDGRVELVRVGLERDEGEHLAVDVGLSACLQLLTDVSGDGMDVVHDHLHVGEDVGVDAL